MPADATPSAIDALLAEVEVASKWMTHATRDYLARTAAPRLAALLAEVEVASKWMTHATRDYLARTAAPRLAAIVRVLRGGLDRYAGIAPGCLASVGGDAARTALARAEAIASGRDPATTPNPTTHTIPADAPASDAGTQHKEP